jgi:hypothetical protein
MAYRTSATSSATFFAYPKNNVYFITCHLFDSLAIVPVALTSWPMCSFSLTAVLCRSQGAAVFGDDRDLAGSSPFCKHPVGVVCELVGCIRHGLGSEHLFVVAVVAVRVDRIAFLSDLLALRFACSSLRQLDAS